LLEASWIAVKLRNGGRGWRENTYCYKLSQSASQVRWVRNDGRSGTAPIGG